jgi:hypothetical protein
VEVNALSRYSQIGLHKTINIVSKAWLNEEILALNSLLELTFRTQQIHKQQKFIGNSSRRKYVAGKKFTLYSAQWWIFSLKIPVNQLVMRKLLDGKSSTASKRKDFFVEMPFYARIYFPLEVSLAFLANVLIFFKCLKVNESHILFSQAPRCECSQVKGEWKKQNFIMNFTLSWKTLEYFLVFVLLKILN